MPKRTGTRTAGRSAATAGGTGTRPWTASLCQNCGDETSPTTKPDCLKPRPVLDAGLQRGNIDDRPGRNIMNATSTAPAGAVDNIVARIERLPTSWWHVRARIIVGVATFFDA